MKIDTHIHTSDFSDGKNSIDEMIEAAQARGLEGMIVTDHNIFLKHSVQENLNQKYPEFKVFMGAEVTMGLEHLLVIGGEYFDIHEYSPDNIQTFKEDVIKSGAYTVLAHPWWKGNQKLDFDINIFQPDAIDVLSMNVDTNRLDESLQIANKYGMHIIAGSDAHSTDKIGLFYIETDKFVSTNKELVTELKEGNYSIEADWEMFADRIEEAGMQEAIADVVISKNGTIDDYIAFGGECKAFYNRRKFGGSYFPDASLIGKRAAEYK